MWMLILIKEKQTT